MKILVSAGGHRIVSRIRNRDGASKTSGDRNKFIRMRIESRLSKCYWSCLAVLLVSHTSLAGLASRSLTRETEEPRGMLSQSLDSLLERQDVLEDTVDFLDNLEADFLIALEELIVDQEAQDRVLLEDVQVNYVTLIFCLST